MAGEEICHSSMAVFNGAVIRGIVLVVVGGWVGTGVE
jgi:hypothetical protein